MMSFWPLGAAPAPPAAAVAAAAASPQGRGSSGGSGSDGPATTSAPPNGPTAPRWTVTTGQPAAAALQRFASDASAHAGFFVGGGDVTGRVAASNEVVATPAGGGGGDAAAAAAAATQQRQRQQEAFAAHDELMAIINSSGRYAGAAERMLLERRGEAAAADGDGLLDAFDVAMAELGAEDVHSPRFSSSAPGAGATRARGLQSATSAPPAGPSPGFREDALTNALRVRYGGAYLSFSLARSLAPRLAAAAAKGCVHCIAQPAPN